MGGSTYVAHDRAGLRCGTGRHHRRSRRSLLRAVVPLVAASVGMSGCWFQPGWGPYRSGHNPFESGLIRANVATLSEAWSVTGSGAVLDPVGSTDGVHAVSGQVLANHDRRDGGQRWTRPVTLPDCPEGCEDAVEVGAPLVAHGRVYVSIFTISTNGATTVFDAATGEPQAPVNAGGWSATIDGDTLAFTSAVRGEPPPPVLRVVNLADRSLGWSTVPGWATFGPAVTLGDDRVHVVNGQLVQVFTRTRPEGCSTGECRPLWSAQLDGFGTALVVSDDGDTLYVATTSGRLEARDTADGTVRWSARVSAATAPPAVGDGWLYVPTSDGRIFVFDAEGCGADICAPVWGAATGSPISKQPALAGGVLYVASDDGSVQAFDAAGCGVIVCVPLWRTSTGSRITGGPVVSFGQLLVGTADGRLIAYRPS